MTKRLENRKVDHPDFYFISKGGYNGLPVVVFDRNYFGKELPVPFSQVDVDSMLAATKKDLVDYDMIEHWGGVGEVYFSISIKHKVRVRRCKEQEKIISKAHALPMFFPEQMTRI